MYIDKMKLINFRNYECQEIQFNKNINIIYGDNAQGKTNILEAIFLSSFGKSFRTSKEKELIKFGQDKLMVEANFQKKDRDGKIRIEIGSKKQITVNGIKIKKLSELLGNINIVIFNNICNSMQSIKPLYSCIFYIIFSIKLFTHHVTKCKISTFFRITSKN